ncbi:helix-turn-helix transcriptional regulator [Phycicoccus sp. BSK3Z-2]|uniref:Helix-turn-helix transcriptional regulator n=1 Tax=Phycicoccus avicenniae TaxID=2828860 RepID=A0A941HZR5_9MICO|nr:helix-turn-helix domain-containing protein [Phycicoccus avicenniae]MBR7744383.1 helix-turn-helix transcriptional regulator [Phycicoccus avicenniae]
MTVSDEVGPVLAQYPDGVIPAGCPSRAVLDHVTSKWGLLVLVSLVDGPHRWSELRRRAQGVSEKMLAQTLRTLESDGFVHREAFPVIPPRVEYSLTPLGEGLARHLVPLVEFVADHAEEVVRRRS